MVTTTLGQQKSVMRNLNLVCSIECKIQHNDEDEFQERKDRKRVHVAIICL